MSRPRTERFNKELIMQVTQNVITTMMTGGGSGGSILSNMLKRKSQMVGDQGDNISVKDQMEIPEETEEEEEETKLARKMQTLSRGSNRIQLSLGAPETDSKTITPP